MNKEVILRLLEEDAFPVSGVLHTAINVNQSGALNEEKLRKEREQYLRVLTSWMAPELIRMKQSYPYNDIANVEFEADFVVMQKDVFDYVKKFVETLIETEEIMNHE